MQRAKSIAYRAMVTLGVIALLGMMATGIDSIRLSFTPVQDPETAFWIGVFVFVGASVVLVSFLVVIFAERLRDWLNRPVLEMMQMQDYSQTRNLCTLERQINGLREQRQRRSWSLLRRR